MFGEGSYAKLPPGYQWSTPAGDRNCWHWWMAGSYGDTMQSCMYPPNPPLNWNYNSPLVNPSPARRRRQPVPALGFEPPPRRVQLRLLRRLGEVHQGHDQLLADRAHRDVPARHRDLQQPAPERRVSPRRLLGEPRLDLRRLSGPLDPGERRSDQRRPVSERGRPRSPGGPAGAAAPLRLRAPLPGRVAMAAVTHPEPVPGTHLDPACPGTPAGWRRWICCGAWS